MKSVSQITVASAITLGAVLQSAFAGGHYVPGVEGVQAASVPPPGLYYLGYLVNYNAGSLRAPGTSNDAAGNNTANVTALANRLAWISNTKVLGADYGAEMLIPVLGVDTKFSGLGLSNQSDSGIGDIFLSPLILAWHGDKWDSAFGAGYWFDTGHYDANNTASVGKGFQTLMLSAGGTYYFDDAKTITGSVLTRYEKNTRMSSGFKPGDHLTVEWGIGKNFGTYSLGLVGYTQSQLTNDDGPNATTNKSSKNAIGVEFSTPFPALGGLIKAAYYSETAAQAGSNPETKGSTLRFTFVKPL